jgi:hypothetical protein
MDYNGEQCMRALNDHDEPIRGKQAVANLSKQQGGKMPTIPVESPKMIKCEYKIT